MTSKRCATQVRRISLIADPDTLRARIEDDVRAGIRDQEAAERALSHLGKYRFLDTELVDTTKLTPHEVALSLAEIGEA